MKKFFYSLLISVLSLTNVQAQVENRALLFTQTGEVDCGVLPEMNGIHSYTLQLWFKPTKWTPNATLMRRGEDMKIALGGATGQIAVTINGTENTISSSSIAVGQWTQLTVINAKGRIRVLVDGSQTASLRIDNDSASMDNSLTLGGDGYEGLLDEVRIWNTALTDEFDYFWNNTLNEFNLMVDNLLVYYKMDHEEWTTSLVDYKSLWAATTTNHHGVITDATFVGVDRRSADQTHVNSKLPYLLNGAYTNTERFIDSSIPRESYLLSNDIICLSILSWNNGHLDYFTPADHATVNGTAKWVSSRDGRKGLLKFDGSDGCTMTSPSTVLSKESNYTIEGWIKMDTWVPNAYILRKGDFSIQLGLRGKQELIINVGDQQYVYETKIGASGWHYIGISPNGTKFNVVVDDEELLATTYGDSTTLPDTSSPVVWGEGLMAFIDDWCIWNSTFTTDEMLSHKEGYPMPSLGGRVARATIDKTNALYCFDDKENLGFDYYSQDNWKRIMESAFDGYRGYNFRISVSSHTDWDKTIVDGTKRQNFADDLARLSGPYAGVELDLEWVYYDSWETFGDLIDQIREALPAEKSFMVSCHNVTYKFVPTNRFPKVDGFTMQQYGPQKVHFTYSSFVDYYNKFKERYPKDKIYLSWASTTSRLYDDNEQLIGAIAGVNWGAMPDSYEPGDDMDRFNRNGGHHYFMTPRQVYKRAKFAQNEACQGIFYWDMANDYRVDSRHMLSRMASYGLNANVDRIVTAAKPYHATATGVTAADPDQSLPEIVELKGERIMSGAELRDGLYVAWQCGSNTFAGKSWIGSGSTYDVSEDADWTPSTAIFRLDDAADGLYYIYNMSTKKYIGHADDKSDRGDFYEIVWCDNTDDPHICKMDIKQVTASGALYMPETAANMFNMDDKAHSTYSSLKVGDTEANFGYIGTNAWKVWLMYRFDDSDVDPIFGLNDAITSVDNTVTTTAVYDLQGRRTANPLPGLYIVNGRKVILK